MRLAFVLAGSPFVTGAQIGPQDTSPDTGMTTKPRQTAQVLTDTKVTDSLVPSPVRRIPPPRQRFSVENGVTNTYDTNIEHDSTNIGSYGIIVGATGRFRSRGSKPGVYMEYGVAVHQYTATDRWDRVSQLGRLGFDIPLGSMLLFGVTGEIYLKGSSEDREVGDQYAVLPRIEIRPIDDVRFRIITGYRQRKFAEAPNSNAINRYVTFDSRIRFGEGTLEGAARFERNLPKITRLRFKRQTYSARYGREVGDRAEVFAGLEYRPVQYPERTVDILDEEGEEIGEEPRVDRRWKPQVKWAHEWSRNVRTDVEYEYEMRFSNDPDKKYRGHVLTVTTAIPWY
ncbi:MAG: hypothetical protein M3O61_05815 [Gemmatimonadota bacterium]|nr:hypothetical protein [Gemmatimonadota bacterium]